MRYGYKPPPCPCCDGGGGVFERSPLLYMGCYMIWLAPLGLNQDFTD